MRAAVILLFAVAAGPALAAGGEDVFNTDCAGCHSLSAASTAGPSLKGVLWRDVASLKDFAYSDGLKAKGGTWTPETLDAYLKDTQTFAPGTDMFFVVRDGARRRAIVDYLKSVK